LRRIHPPSKTHPPVERKPIESYLKCAPDQSLTSAALYLDCFFKNY
jgi:hypothetical protein